MAFLADIDISNVNDMIKHVDWFPEKTFLTIFIIFELWRLQYQYLFEAIRKRNFLHNGTGQDFQIGLFWTLGMSPDRTY